MVAADTEDASIPQTMVTSGRQKLLANRIDENLSIQTKLVETIIATGFGRR
jgi:hypothetical protein